MGQKLRASNETRYAYGGPLGVGNEKECSICLFWLAMARQVEDRQRRVVVLAYHSAARVLVILGIPDVAVKVIRLVSRSRASREITAKHSRLRTTTAMCKRSGNIGAAG